MTTLSCATSASQLVMNYVQPAADHVLKLSSNAALACTIEARNGQFSTFSSGELYSSSNYLKIKRLALDNSIVNVDTGKCVLTFVPGSGLLGMAIPPSSTIQAQINKILARG